MGKTGARALSVCVVYSPGVRTVAEYPLLVPEGATVLDALRSSGLLDAMEESQLNPEWLGIWGRKASPSQTLRDGDRVEIYRPLQVDPKVARRERFQKQGSRAAGLFAKRRSNAKPGY